MPSKTKEEASGKRQVTGKIKTSFRRSFPGCSLRLATCDLPRLFSKLLTLTPKNLYQPSEEELREWLLLTADGDETAFTRLLRLYWNKVYTQALTYLKSSELAQEITQDVFIKIWNTRDKLPQVESFSNYLFIVSRNEIISSLRKKAINYTNPTEDVEDQVSKPDEQLENKELNKRLLSAIEQLPPTRKKVFKMSRLEGKSYEEIGNELGISRNGVKDHIVNALNFLRTHFRFTDEYLFILAIGSLLAFK